MPDGGQGPYVGTGAVRRLKQVVHIGTLSRTRLWKVSGKSLKKLPGTFGVRTRPSRVCK